MPAIRNNGKYNIGILNAVANIICTVMGHGERSNSKLTYLYSLSFSKKPFQRIINLIFDTPIPIYALMHFQC